MANYMTNLRTIPFQIAYFSSDYNELLAAVPFTSLCGQANAPVVTSMPILWLNNVMAVLGGRIFYALPKFYVSFSVANPAKMDNLTMYESGQAQAMIEMTSRVNTSVPLSFAAALKRSKMLQVLQLLNSQTIYDHGADASDPHMCSGIVFDFANGTFFVDVGVEMSFAANGLPGIGAFSLSSKTSPTVFLSASWQMPNPLNFC
jgi:hypothetical protein